MNSILEKSRNLTPALSCPGEGELNSIAEFKAAADSISRSAFRTFTSLKNQWSPAQISKLCNATPRLTACPACEPARFDASLVAVPVAVFCAEHRGGAIDSVWPSLSGPRMTLAEHNKFPGGRNF